MINYTEYVKRNKDAITLTQVEEIFNQLLSAIDFNNSDAAALYSNLIESAVQYSSIRSQWLLLSKEERIENDHSRTLAHDSLIISINALSRYLSSHGKDITWRSKLGEERKRIGDFACYIALFYGLNAR